MNLQPYSSTNSSFSTRFWEIVKDLLMKHDCVILPGFGGFVANPEPARIDQVTHMILPPGKHIIFNQNLKTNDGLLAGKVVETLHINYPEAIKQIEGLVEEVKHLLNEKKQFPIDSFGNFRLNADANYVFLPDKLNTYLTSSYGLMPLQAEPAGAKARKIRSGNLFKERKTETPAGSLKGNVPKRISRRLKANAALVFVALFLYGGGWFLLRNQRTSGFINNTEMNITGWFDSIFSRKQEVDQPKTEPVIVMEDTTTPAPPVPREEVVELPVSPLEKNTETQLAESSISLKSISSDQARDLDLFGKHIASARIQWYVPGQNAIQPETTTPAEEVKPEEITGIALPDNERPKPLAPVAAKAIDYSKFYVIGGVFCKERNAQHFFHNMLSKGFDSELLLNEQNNCHRVSLGKFTTKLKAEQFLAEMKAGEFPDAWLLKGDQ